MIEFDPVNSFHLHSGMFNYTASGTENTSPITTDCDFRTGRPWNNRIHTKIPWTNDDTCTH